MARLISYSSSSNLTSLLPYSNIHPKSLRKHIPSSLNIDTISSHSKLEPNFECKRWKKVVLFGGDHTCNRRRWTEVQCKGKKIEKGGSVATVVEGNRVYQGAERFKVVGLVALVLCLCNVNRVVMSVAVVPMAHNHAWSTSFIGIVQQSSFLWGYVVSSLIGGALADKFGGARVMAWGFGFSALATLLTPWAANYSAASLLAVRAFFGLAQGVVIPSMNIILSRWFPIHERSRALGLAMAGFNLGNVFGLCLTPILILQTGISSPFLLYSFLGLLWLVAWVFRVTNDPRKSQFVSRSELVLIQLGKAKSSARSNQIPPVGLLLSKWPSWAIIFANFTNNWGYFVLLSWMPIYFKTVLNVNINEAAWFSAVPWALMALSSYAAGAASDSLIKAGYSLILVRKFMQSIGFVGPGLMLLCLNYAKTPGAASMLLTMALSFSAFSQAGFILNIQDVAPNATGLLHGIANATGTLAAITSTIGAGYFVEWLGSFKAFLSLTAMLYFTTALLYNLYAAAERVI